MQGGLVKLRENSLAQCGAEMKSGVENVHIFIAGETADSLDA